MPTQRARVILVILERSVYDKHQFESKLWQSVHWVLFSVPNRVIEEHVMASQLLCLPTFVTHCTMCGHTSWASYEIVNTNIVSTVKLANLLYFRPVTLIVSNLYWGKKAYFLKQFLLKIFVDDIFVACDMYSTVSKKRQSTIFYMLNFRIYKFLSLISVISQNWYDTGKWSRSSWKKRGRLSFITDHCCLWLDLPTQGAKDSTAQVILERSVYDRHQFESKLWPSCQHWALFSVPNCVIEERVMARVSFYANFCYTLFCVWPHIMGL